MCCRYYIESSPYFIELGELARKTTDRSRLKPDKGNVCVSGEVNPGMTVPVLASNKTGQRIAFLMYWGFTAKNNSLVINARSESAAERPMFREPWAAHRCIIPASWYFEWEHFKRPDGSSRKGDKYSLQPLGQDKTFLCGLYRMENNFPHFAVLTREPADSLRPIHDRMPLILPEDHIDDWIKPGNDPAEVAKHAITEMVFEKVLQDTGEARPDAVFEQLSI